MLLTSIKRELVLKTIFGLFESDHFTRGLRYHRMMTGIINILGYIKCCCEG